MQDAWRDKVVLITGASSGFGLALAKAYAAAGARVVLVARDLERLQQALAALPAGAPEATLVAADIRRDDDVRRMIDDTLARHGRLDALVNNAGRSSRGTLLATPLDEYRDQWELNFLALVRCTQAAAPHLIATRGQVVNIGSLAAKAASRFIGAYAASKFPVAAFSQQLRLELAEEGVNVLLVCPGPIRRDDDAPRYQAEGIPASAQRPGGGVKLRGLDPDRLAAQVVRASAARRVELVVPGKARLLFALSQLSPRWGDWILRRMT